MKVAHLSDLHLGYGTHDSGRGRAADVVRVFETALARIGDLRPDLVVVSGDVFDHPNVTAPPIAAFSKAVRELHRRLPGVVVAVAAGARDTPLDPDRHGPLTVVGGLDLVEVATVGVRRIRIADGELGVTLVPHLAVMTSHALDVAPDPEVRRNVLVTYAAVTKDSAHALPLRETGWDYVALGSSHGYRCLSERICYAGSLERVGEDPWEEAATDKGFITVDLDAGTHRFWPVEARAVVSLAPVEATGGGAATVARRLTEALAGVPGGIDGKLLRIPVRGLSADDLAALDREILEPVRRRVAELRIDSLPGQGSSHGRDGDTPRAGEGSEDDAMLGVLQVARRLMEGGSGLAPPAREREAAGL